MLARSHTQLVVTRAMSLGVAVIAMALALGLVDVGPADAAAGWWRVAARAAPSSLPPGGKATLIVSASNVGDSALAATSVPVRITDTLPPGLEATAVEGAPAFEELEEGHKMSCELQPETVSCASAPEVLAPFQALEMTIQVNVKSDAASGEQTSVTVSGGEQESEPGKQPAAVSLGQPITVSGQSTPFGIEQNGYQFTPEEEGGAPDTQAASHPFQLTTTLNLNESTEAVRERNPVAAAPALPQRLAFNLPPGMIGDPRAVPRCSDADFQAIFLRDINACPAESAIGVAVVTLNEPAQFHNITRAVPLWNLQPAKGEPARFGFEILKVPVVLDTSLRSSGDYGVTVTVNQAPQAAQLLASEVTIWGTPAAQTHDPSRGWDCLNDGEWVEHKQPCSTQSPPEPKAFLTLPSSCTGPIETTVEGDSWPVQTLASEPGETFALEGPQTEDLLPGLKGCEHIPFTPTLKLEPDTDAASTPTGLKADVHLPQQPTLAPQALGEADLVNTTVTLPAGVQLNPSSANGLQACTEQQIGYEGQPGTDLLSPGAPQPLRFSSAAAECPEASKVGAVRVYTPLLEHELQGAVYLAEPAPQGEMGKNPFNSLIALYIVAEDPESGITVKLAGEAKLNGQTGQLTSTFASTPQVPFEDLELEFFDGPRAALTTPALCGASTTEASFTPWSNTSPVSARSAPGEFQTDTGPNGTACADPLPFAPSLTAGATSPQAGAFTPFTLQIERPDGQQALSALTVELPAGSAAMLANVTPCPGPQAAQGACGPESEIGQATATAGLGPDPYTVTGGRVYITGPYQGAPYGLTIVTPADAGPFHLGNVVVRSKIEINPHTAQVTITSSLPQIVQPVGREATGIPLQLKDIYVTVNRPNFEYNPTSCAPLDVAATLTGSEGTTSNTSSLYQVTGCQNLSFKPTVTATTQGKTSKANGASLGLTFKSKTGEAHVARTILTIPATLPARLTTIQKACIADVFETNPATCPEGSDIGTATVHTPVLKQPLTGPIYLVSHGNAAWPDAELVLQGEGITVILDGQTAIKKGITTSSFLSVPDAPFESVQATLPEGPHSALTTNLPFKDHYSLCGQSLSIPAALTGQNGTAINEDAKVKIEDCAPKANKTKKRRRRRRRRHAR
jgi:hypothetical protein